jgi:hypothetical protein
VARSTRDEPGVGARPAPPTGSVAVAALAKRGVVDTMPTAVTNRGYGLPPKNPRFVLHSGQFLRTITAQRVGSNRNRRNVMKHAVQFDTPSSSTRRPVRHAVQFDTPSSSYAHFPLQPRQS